mgnify:CR=1 FL=1
MDEDLDGKDEIGTPATQADITPIIRRPRETPRVRDNR